MKRTQYDGIIRYIDKYGSITPMEAYEKLGCTKLATRISELNRRGYVVDKVMIEFRNRRGEIGRCMQYSNIRKCS